MKLLQTTIYTKYTNIMDNPVEMDKYPEMCNHPRLNQEETKYE